MSAAASAARLVARTVSRQVAARRAKGEATEWLRFLGANIKGTPRMSADRVLDDIDVLEDRCDSIVLCEFRWNYYWGQARRILTDARGATWKSFPPFGRGFAFPVRSAQPCLWKEDVFTKVRGRLNMIHRGRAGVSESRYIRSTLLAHIRTGLRAWHLVSHFVVGGDAKGDSPLRKGMLQQDMLITDQAIAKAKRSGWPVILQLDANIHRGGWAYAEWMRIVRKHDGEIVGPDGGVEFIVVFQGRKARIEVDGTFEVKPKRAGGPLNTDHEARGMKYRLVRL